VPTRVLVIVCSCNGAAADRRRIVLASARSTTDRRRWRRDVLLLATLTGSNRNEVTELFALVDGIVSVAGKFFRDDGSGARL
jgi:hypothetical protein